MAIYAQPCLGGTPIGPARELEPGNSFALNKLGTPHVAGIRSLATIKDEDSLFIHPFSIDDIGNSQLHHYGEIALIRDQINELRIEARGGCLPLLWRITYRPNQ